MTAKQLEKALMDVLRRNGCKFTTNRYFDHIIDKDKTRDVEYNVTELANLLHEELKL